VDTDIHAVGMAPLDPVAALHAAWKAAEVFK
jgi:hypothetical protein